MRARARTHAHIGARTHTHKTNRTLHKNKVSKKCIIQISVCLMNLLRIFDISFSEKNAENGNELYDETRKRIKSKDVPHYSIPRKLPSGLLSKLLNIKV